MSSSALETLFLIWSVWQWVRSWPQSHSQGIVSRRPYCFLGVCWRGALAPAWGNLTLLSFSFPGILLMASLIQTQILLLEKGGIEGGGFWVLSAGSVSRCGSHMWVSRCILSSPCSFTLSSARGLSVFAPCCGSHIGLMFLKPCRLISLKHHSLECVSLEESALSHASCSFLSQCNFFWHHTSPWPVSHHCVVRLLRALCVHE